MKEDKVNKDKKERVIRKRRSVRKRRRRRALGGRRKGRSIERGYSRYRDRRLLLIVTVAVDKVGMTIVKGSSSLVIDGAVVAVVAVIEW